jgi:hypothetical protein
MTGKEIKETVEGSDRGLIEVISQNLPGVTDKTTKPN